MLQPRKMVPILMQVSCGLGDDIQNVVVPLMDGGMVEVIGTPAALATEHSFVAVANGWSMSADNLPEDIKPGDMLLMTPYDEYKLTLKENQVVLAKVVYKDGSEALTLKVFAGGDCALTIQLLRVWISRKIRVLLTLRFMPFAVVCWKGVWLKVFGSRRIMDKAIIIELIKTCIPSLAVVIELLSQQKPGKAERNQVKATKP
jgi:hypothetical protein